MLSTPVPTLSQASASKDFVGGPAAYLTEHDAEYFFGNPEFHAKKMAENFRNVLCTDRPGTVDFGGFEGGASFDDIQHWVTLCTTITIDASTTPSHIVNAHSLAQAGIQEDSGGQTRSDTMDLLSLIGLAVPARSRRPVQENSVNAYVNQSLVDWVRNIIQTKNVAPVRPATLELPPMCKMNPAQVNWQPDLGTKRQPSPGAVFGWVP